jgi:hypothetical protein
MPPATWSLAVVANYGISDSAVNWRLLFDIVSWEWEKFPRLYAKINGLKFKGRIDDSKLFKANQGFFGKNFSFLKTEWKRRWVFVPWHLCC